MWLSKGAGAFCFSTAMPAAKESNAVKARRANRRSFMAGEFGKGERRFAPKRIVQRVIRNLCRCRETLPLAKKAALCCHGQCARPREIALFAAARGQSRRLAALGRG